MPASETVDFEREFADLVRELRAIPSEAPPELRERVRALGEPQPKRTFRLPRSSRRAVLVLASACVLAVAGAAVVYGLVASSGEQRQSLEASGTVPKRVHANPKSSPSVQRGVFGPVTTTPPFALSDSVAGPAPNPNRYQNYQASLRVRVKDFDSLGKRTADAMQITRQLGGYVASVEQSTTSGAPGEADLVLRVPVGHVQTAMIRLSTLGTVLDQHARRAAARKDDNRGETACRSGDGEGVHDHPRDDDVEGGAGDIRGQEHRKDSA